jgi:protein-S-isoprenylcysteine O-methyltransferase Ste14
MLSLTAYMGYGLLPGYVYVLSIGYMALFQYIECKGDYDLAEFVKRKRAGLTTAKVCTEKSWSVTRHPNHLGFIHWWLPHTLMATSNPWTVLYVFSFLHFWILCLGIPSNEQYMLEAYGDEYATYQSKVPMLYPKLIKTEEDGKNGLFPTEFTALLHDAH